MLYRMLAVGCLVMMIAGTVQADDTDTKKKKKAGFNVKRILGDWEYATGKRAGDEVAKERLAGVVSITKETFTLPGGPDATFVMSYTIDATKTPAHIDLKIKSGPVPEGSTVGIIKMEKGTLTLCYDPAGANRPEKFESTEDNGAFLFTLKRKAKGDKPAKKKK
jgi:uncharacterized protein (TIGR03067 family)